MMGYQEILQPTKRLKEEAEKIIKDAKEEVERMILGQGKIKSAKSINVGALQKKYL